MSAIYVNAGNGSGDTGTSIVVNMTGTPAAGSLVVIAVWLSGTTVLSVGGSSTWVVRDPVEMKTGVNLQICYTLSAAGGESSYTVNFNGATDNCYMVAGYWTVSSGAFTIDGGNSGAGTGTNIATAAYNTTNAEDFLVCAMMNDSGNAIAAGADYTTQTELWNTAIRLEYRNVVATNSYTGTGSMVGSEMWAADMVAFKAPAAGGLTGTVCWGHDTGVTEDNIRDFTGNWTGTGYIFGSGDSETLSFSVGEYEESETFNVGAMRIKIVIDKYGTGFGSKTVKYKNGASQALCEADTWHTYSVPFVCSGWVKVRIEA